MSTYQTVIGMEVHAQLQTRSKMFCGCDAKAFGAAPNTHTCPVCLALPGALPVINRRAVEQTIMVGLALHCRIAEVAVFSRKNYFYPDLPKAYQISMYDFPLCRHGYVEIEGADGQPRRIRIRRVHLEEDTAKSIHAGDHSLVDFNRAGLPLIEIVTEPDIRTPEEARRYLVKLRAILRTLGVSTADMEKGAMRCEANISLRPEGRAELGVKVEVKNLNSFRAVKQALEYEIARQGRLLDAGGRVRQVTMGWDEQHGRTVEQRSKETAEDYRYFPEPDLPPLHVSPAWVEEIAAALPELPEARQARFVTEYGLSPADAAILTAEREVADYTEEAMQAGQRRGIAPRVMGNWVVGDLFRLLRAAGADIEAQPVTPNILAELVALVEQGTITAGSGRKVLEEIFAHGGSPEEIVRKKGLAQISDADALSRIVTEVVAAHPEEAARYRDGKESLLQWFVGQVMRATRGKANPQIVQSLLRETLNNPA